MSLPKAVESAGGSVSAGLRKARQLRPIQNESSRPLFVSRIVATKLSWQGRDRVQPLAFAWTFALSRSALAWLTQASLASPLRLSHFSFATS